MRKIKYFLVGLCFHAHSALAAEPPQFVKFAPIIVSIMDNHRVTGLLSITVHAEAATSEKRELAEKLRPRLQDAFTRKVLELGEIYISPDRKIDVGFVAAHMQAAAKSALPDVPLKIYVFDASTRKL
jgi:predicted metal-dependent enzyme (double-stranded beta helix superfamily)